jgi:indolepyruvate ferredoxin oxidoreductase alpha subunit
VLVLEEGQPNFVEQNISDIVRRHNVDVTLHGKDLLPLAGEYNTATMLKGLRAFMEKYERIEPLPARKPRVIPMKVETVERPKAEQASLVEVEAAWTRTFTPVRQGFVPAVPSVLSLPL